MLIEAVTVVNMHDKKSLVSCDVYISARFWTVSGLPKQSLGAITSFLAVQHLCSLSVGEDWVRQVGAKNIEYLSNSCMVLILAITVALHELY